MAKSIDQAALTDFIRRYSGDFKASTVAGMAQYFCEQVTTVHDNKVTQYNSSAEFVTFLSQSVKALEAEGFSHTLLDEIHIHPLRDNSILVSANFNRLNTEGSLFAKVGASYVVIQTGEKFKIAVILGQHLENLVRCDRRLS